MHRRPRRIPRVGVFWEPRFASGRQIILGIADYIRQHGPWHIFSDVPLLAEQLPPLDRWNGDGIIGLFPMTRNLRRVLQLGLPVVDLWGSVKEIRIPQVLVDNQAAGRIAADHLLDMGLRRFAVLCLSTWYAEQRCMGFRERIAEAAFQCAVCRARPSWIWNHSRTAPAKSVAEWLQGLAKPVGLFATNDDVARRAARGIRSLGFRIPQDIAVIGCGNDQLQCEFLPEPLSSVEIPFRKIGYTGAAVLDRMMRGKPAPKKPVLLPAGKVIHRRSTDIAAHIDPEVSEAIQYIRENAYGPLHVEDVLQQTRISRRTLEYRFRKAIGRTPYQEIQRVRIERAKQLLRETALPLTRIAPMAGYRSTDQLCVVFRRKLDITPLEYRLHHETTEI